MSQDTFEKVSLPVKEIILNAKLNLQYLKEIKPEKVVEQFKYDKKGDGISVPLILIERPGKMFFYKHFLIAIVKNFYYLFLLQLMILSNGIRFQSVFSP